MAHLLVWPRNPNKCTEDDLILYDITGKLNSGGSRPFQKNKRSTKEGK